MENMHAKHLQELRILARSLATDKNGTAIVCGATRLGRVMTRELQRLGVKVLAMTDQNPAVSQGKVGNIPILALEEGLRLRPAALLIGAVNSANAIQREALNICHSADWPIPAIYMLP